MHIDISVKPGLKIRIWLSLQNIPLDQDPSQQEVFDFSALSMSSQPSTSSNTTTPTPSGRAGANKGKGKAVSSDDTEESTSTPGHGQSQKGKNWSERDSILLVEAWVHHEGTKKCVYAFY